MKKMEEPIGEPIIIPGDGREIAPPNALEIIVLQGIREHWQRAQMFDRIVIVKTPGGPVMRLEKATAEVNR